MPTNSLDTSREIFAGLIAPVSIETFFEEYYGRKPFLAPGKPMAIHPTYALEDLTAKLTCLESVYAQDFGLARNGETLRAAVLSARMQSPDWLDRLLDEGWTLSATTVHRTFLPLRRLSDHLGEILKCDVNINAYYTPPGTQGFTFHGDQHDVFLWQQSGRKAWKVMGVGDHEDSASPAIDTILEPGQILYIPEQCRHAGVACEGESSFHATIGFHSRWAQVKKILARRMTKWIENEIPADGVESLATPDQLPDSITKTSPDEARTVLTTLRSLLSRELKEDTITHPAFEKYPIATSTEAFYNQEVESYNNAAFRLGQPASVNDAGTTLELDGGSLQFRPRFAAAIRQITQGRAYRAQDLPLATPDQEHMARLMFVSGLSRLEGP